MSYAAWSGIGGCGQSYERTHAIRRCCLQAPIAAKAKKRTAATVERTWLAQYTGFIAEARTEAWHDGYTALAKYGMHAAGDFHVEVVDFLERTRGVAIAVVSPQHRSKRSWRRPGDEDGPGIISRPCRNKLGKASRM
jgi:hypothetical protein